MILPKTGCQELLPREVPQQLPLLPLSTEGGSAGRVGSACAPLKSASEPSKSTHALFISGQTSPGL